MRFKSERLRNIGTSLDPKAVTNIISGKVVSRAMWGHFLVEAELMLTVLLSCEQNGDEASELGLDQDISGEVETSTQEQKMRLILIMLWKTDLMLVR